MNTLDNTAYDAPVPSDALVFFGSTGDLAAKKIFPALFAMVKRRNLELPIIGVAFAKWTLEQFQNFARDSIKAHCQAATADEIAGLVKLLHYVDGEYEKADTFD